jgi:dipeptidyl aminopeptidase/acylaminoacyl peptidase
MTLKTLLNKRDKILILLVTISFNSLYLVAEPSHTIEPNDFFSVSTIQSSVISPTGKKVAWAESRWDETLNQSVKNIWVVNTKTKEKQRITFSNVSDTNPTWSPDEKHLYFSRTVATKSNLKDKAKNLPQVFRYSFLNQKIIQVTQAPKGVKQFQLTADGSQLYFTTTKEQIDKDVWAELRKTHSSPKYGHGKVNVNPMMKLDLKHWRTNLVLDDNKVVWDFKLSNDKAQLARITTSDNELVHLEGWSNIEVYHLASKINVILPDKLWRAQAPSPYGWLEGLAWSDDSKALAFRADYDGYPGEAYVFEINQGKINSSLKLERIADITMTGSDTLWQPDSRTLCYRAADHGRIPVVCTKSVKNGRQGKSFKALGNELVSTSFSFDQSGSNIAFVHNGLNHFNDIFISKIRSTAKNFKRLTDINPQTQDWKLPTVELVKWKAKDGTIVEGILERPYGYKKNNGPLPTIIQLHGGPTSATPFALRFRHYGQTSFAAQGWAVMSPNYRGSTGYGDKFLTQLVGNENNIEVNDILSGVDALVERGIADPDKLAVMGWSNGGYLTNALISKTDRFKAASSGAGNLDQKLQWIVEDTPGHVVNFMQGQPWEKLEAYNHSSPLSFIQNVKTPTLIHMGENDPRVPIAHAKGLYRALKQYLNVPVELVIYPDEGHGLSQYQHRKAKMDWDMKWFNYYVLGKKPQ